MRRNRWSRAIRRAWWTAVPLLVLFVAFPSSTLSAQDYRSSVVGTDFDFIREGDPSAALCLEYKGVGPREMPDKRGRSALIQPAFVFVAYFTDGTSVDIAIDGDFAFRDAARKEAERYVPRLGKLPTSLRAGVRRLVVHRGGVDTTAFSDVGLIVVYSDNATKRISTHDLEETVFHESVHAAWDERHADSDAWRAAQRSDDAFVTHYARKNPDGEDLAESALFAYTLVHHPDRIPAEHAARIRKRIPARIAFVRKLIPPGRPVVYRVGPKYAADGSGRTFAVRGKAPDPSLERIDPGAVACTVDITTVGDLSDILSNALMRGLGHEEKEVRALLDRASERYENTESLLEAARKKFGVDRKALDAQIDAFLHCNCAHEADRKKPPSSQPVEKRPGRETCTVNIKTVGGLSDILSNALMRGLHQDEKKVRALLDRANERYKNTEALLKAAEARFGFDRATLDAQIKAFLHCNCSHQ